MLDWTHIAPPMLAAFLASLVEFVEALTIVLAVGMVGGWRPALSGVGAGLGLLVALVAVLGRSLAAAPIHGLQLVLGGLSLLFGMRWLRKAVLRGAGLMAPHDEAALFIAEIAVLRTGRALAWMTAFKAVVVEGLEVIFIVIALGSAGQALVPAAAGATLAFAMVVMLGLALHRPLTRVPENALKFTVGSLVSSFGLYWVGEGLGFGWPGGDTAILGLIAGWALLALLLIRMLKLQAEAPR
jgi:uncharacterized membrane protein